jgi:uncharacterized protein involved in outer membrane biogenesis
MIRKFVILILIAAFFIYFSFQRFLTGLAGKGMEAALGVPVKVSKLHLRLAPLEVGLYGLRIGNPPGFQEPYLADIPEIFIRVNLLGFLKGKAHIQKVTLNMKEVAVERTKDNKFNLNELMKISKAQKTQKEEPQPPSPTPEGEPGKAPKPSKPVKLEIDEVLLNIGKVTFADYGSGQRVVREFGFEIKDMILRDVADPFELVAQIIVIILKKIGFAAMNIQIDSMSQNLQTQAGQLMEQAKSALADIFK